ncbi:PAQR family membrane homeostasis protein TrhA [Georgenia sp. H159]|uniref:PAQR family membrane homeostasis protein TrhA n=1 Tax=Georgenia sp. H159 TaxID=3076115 RepID=UPI002D796F4A|nr:hemolysin III family protein [Georgenia sp. H159]
MNDGSTADHRTSSPGDEASGSLVAAVKPRLRGWIHAGTAPLAVVAGIVLVVLAPPGPATSSTAVFAVAAVLLFGCSAVYHRGTWSAPVAAVLRRLDHANIFLLIAGTYTPLAVLLLPRDTASVLLTVVWLGALAGILMRVFWMGAPRWLYVPIYMALGWVAVWFLPDFGRAGSPVIMWFVIAGGLCYTLGALVYGTKWPNPSPRWFGFHEIFHVGTVGGYLCHYVAVLLAATAAG